MEQIRYKAGYKYVLADQYSVQTPIRPAVNIPDTVPPVYLYPDGLLSIRKGYAWDGPSGPAVDTPAFMRGSLVHDALYQLMREGHLDAETYREPIDKLLRVHCREDGMGAVRAWWVYRAVRLGGEKSSRVGREVLTAPRKRFTPTAKEDKAK